MNADIENQAYRAVVIISSDIEWEEVRRLYPEQPGGQSPYGALFCMTMQLSEGPETVLFMQGGWGKIAAAASAQYALGRWSPKLLVNLGTCGGFRGDVQEREILLVKQTLVYDIREAMTGETQAREHYTTELDLGWLQGAPPVRIVKMVSADRDLLPEYVARLRREFRAVAADWESGAIAWTARRNATRCLILRGVSDLVDEEGGDAYDGSVNLFRENARLILKTLVHGLPVWLEQGLRN